jgi:hypothetical protein
VSENGSRADGSSEVSITGSAGRQGADEIALHRIHLSGGRDAVPGARAAVDLLAGELFDEPAREDIRLMVSELVANSVRHGGAIGGEEDIEITVLIAETLLRVECSDPAAGFAVPQPAAGYGLEIIDVLSSAWGAAHGETGATWFEYPRDGPPPPMN